MSFSLASIFGTSTPAPVAAPATPDASATATPTASSDGKPPFDKSTTPDPAPAPLDKFSDLFTVAAVDPNNPVQDPNAPYFTLPTDEQLQTQVASMKFINPETHGELLVKASQGDVGALTALLNSVGQNSYAQGARLSARVAEDATRNGVSRMTAGLPGQIRTNLARANVSELNPAFNNPALAPLVQAARATIEQKYPNATPNELASLTNEYMNAVRDTLKEPTPTLDPRHGGNTQVQNFGDFFGGNR